MPYTQDKTCLSQRVARLRINVFTDQEKVALIEQELNTPLMQQARARVPTSL